MEKLFFLLIVHTKLFIRHFIIDLTLGLVEGLTNNKVLKKALQNFEALFLIPKFRKDLIYQGENPCGI